MGIICATCKKDILKTDGCVKTVLLYNGEYYDPIKVGDYGDYNYGMAEDSRCGDCGAK